LLPRFLFHTTDTTLGVYSVVSTLAEILTLL
jgi:hypothetical protein